MMGAYSNWWVNGTVVISTLLTVSICVLLHFEGLVFISRRLPNINTPHRIKIVYVIAAILALHVTEIWIFGLAEWILLSQQGFGAISGQTESHLHLFDIIYLSASTFTTVGYGDLAPTGPIRFMLGTEALTGFVLITWSASFTYLEMERFWRKS